MQTFNIAHLNIQSVNVIIVFLNQLFESKSPDEQRTIQLRLQSAATGAGLAGNVVPVWRDQLGRTKFIAPRQQHPFFASVSYEYLFTQVNRTLTCN